MLLQVRLVLYLSDRFAAPEPTLVRDYAKTLFLWLVEGAVVAGSRALSNRHFALLHLAFYSFYFLQYFFYFTFHLTSHFTVFYHILPYFYLSSAFKDLLFAIYLPEVQIF